MHKGIKAINVCTILFMLILVLCEFINAKNFETEKGVIIEVGDHNWVTQAQTAVLEYVSDIFDY